MSSRDYAVRFEEVTKRYPRGGPSYASVRHELAEAVRGAGARLRGRGGRERGTLALENVSFDVERGESFAIVGPNGSGKSTALKLMTRISYPTSGVVRVRGRVGALIEVGGGIHPELTGRENINLYGQILGMKRSEVRRRFDEIVEFAELAHVLDRQVKLYSTGMQLRLGFSIAAHLEPDVFVVDEALAVGDAGFQAKCVERMTALVHEGATLLFVSHDLSAVEAVCRRALFLLNGEVRQVGETKDVLRTYLDWVDSSRHARLHHESERPRSSSYMELQQVSLHGADGDERDRFETGDDMEVRLRFRALVPLERPYVSIGLSDGRPWTLVLCSMLVDGGAPERVDGDVIVSCRLRGLPLMPRVYQIWCSVRSRDALGDVFDWQQVGAFRVGTSGLKLEGPAAQAHAALDGPIHVAHEWDVAPAGTVGSPAARVSRG